MSKFFKSKLYQLIRLLSAEEFEELGNWLRSPVFKPAKRLGKIYTILKQHRKADTLTSLTKQQIYSALYPDKSYRASYFNNLIRSFTVQVEEYLIWSSSYFQKNKKLAYFSELRKRGEHDLFFKETSQFLKEQEATKDQLPFDAAFLFQLHELIYYHSGNQSKYETHRTATQLLNQYLETFFLEKKLALLHEKRTQAKIKKLDFEQNKTYQLDDFLEQYKSPIAILYHKRISSDTSLSMDVFIDFYESYLRVFDQLPNRERQIFLLACINDAVILTSKGVKDSSRQLMNLYKFGIRENLLLTPEVATPVMFNNIVSVAIQENELDYLKELIWRYRQLLPMHWRADALTWAELNIAYAEGKYLLVIEVLRAHQHQHWLYKLQYKIIEMMTLYELVIEGEYQLKSMDALVMSFRKFVQRNDHKYQFRPEPYEAFIKFTHELTKKRRTKKNIPTKEKEAFLKRIGNTPQLYRREWLIAQLNS